MLVRACASRVRFVGGTVGRALSYSPKGRGGGRPSMVRDEDHHPEGGPRRGRRGRRGRGEDDEDDDGRPRGGRRNEEEDDEDDEEKGTGWEAPPGAVVWDVEVRDPRPLRFGFLPDDLKRMIYNEHVDDPVKNDSLVLSKKYGLPNDRIRAIIYLKGIEAEKRHKGEPIIMDGLTQEFEMWAVSALDALSQKHKVDLRKNEAHAKSEHIFAAENQVRTETREELLEDDEDPEELLERAKQKLERARAYAQERETRAHAQRIIDANRDPGEIVKGSYIIKDLSKPTKRPEIATKGTNDRRAACDDINRSWGKKIPFMDKDRANVQLFKLPPPVTVPYEVEVDRNPTKEDLNGKGLTWDDSMLQEPLDFKRPIWDPQDLVYRGDADMED